MQSAFVGIDVAFAKKKRLPICICTVAGGRLEPVVLLDRHLPKPPAGKGNRASLDSGVVEGFVDEVADYLQEIERALGLRIERVALDAPSAPMAEGLVRREAEKAMDERGISCFGTPSRAKFDVIREKVQQHLAAGGLESRLPSANQLWMLAGFALFDRLSKHYPCREVFPQAIVVALGAGGKHKSKKEGYAAQLAAAAQANGLTTDALRQALTKSGYGSMHDRLDAYLSAWVASLPESKLEACGKAPDDVIWVPDLSDAPRL